jgi:hypothetical protein
MLNAIDVTSSLTGVLATKVDKVTGKGLSTNDYTTAEKTKLAAVSGTNTGDQDLSGYATTAQLATKANSSDVTTSLATKANASDVTTSLATKANSSDVTTGLATKVDKVTGKELSTNDYTTSEKTKLAAITGTNTGDQVNITGNAGGNAGTATKLQNARNINGVAFDGSANITIPTSGTVPVANGGTGITTAPANGQILIGNGTGFTLATLSAGTGVSITNGTGSITINSSARSWTDQPTVSANQTSFTLTYAPTASSKIWMFINGVRTNNNAYSFSGTTVTYVPASNGAYAILASDRVQFDYTY